MGKMFFRKYTQSWYCKLDGKFVLLDKDKEAAEQKWHEVMAFREPGQVESITVKALLKRYAEWFKKNRAASTANSRIPKLKSFSRAYGGRRASSIKPLNVRDWINTYYPNAGPTYEHDLILAIQAAFQWATDEGYLRSNPIRRVRKPTRHAREEFIPKEKWKQLLRACTTPEFRTIVWFCLVTGARAEEIPIIRAEHFDGVRIVIPAKLAKGKHRTNSRVRVIYLPARFRTRLMKHSNGPMFRNSNGRAWSKDSINCAMRRTKKRLNWPVLNMTMLRHSFAHDQVRRGTDALVLAQLMGHVDTRMLARVYAHVGAADDVLEATIQSHPKSRPA